MADVHRAAKQFYMLNYSIDELLEEANSERITFPGSDPKEFKEGQRVVASFPGKHGKAWNLLSSAVCVMPTTCVFLPDTKSENGYGVHDPPNSENCHCMSLYNGKAEHGCRWYTLWMEKIRQAESKGTRFIVVTKMDAGLGESQKGEVEFLKKSGIPYTEMPIYEFVNVYALLVQTKIVFAQKELGQHMRQQVGYVEEVGARNGKPDRCDVGQHMRQQVGYVEEVGARKGKPDRCDVGQHMRQQVGYVEEVGARKGKPDRCDVGQHMGKLVGLVEGVGAPEGKPDRCNVLMPCARRDITTCHYCGYTYCSFHIDAKSFSIKGGHICTNPPVCSVNDLSKANCKGELTICRRCGYKYCRYHSTGMFLSLQGGHHCP